MSEYFTMRMFVFIIIQSYICKISKLKMTDLASDAAVMFMHQKRSIMWNHFERKKKHSICTHCGKSFAYYRGTSNLCSHLKNAHPSVWSTANSEDEEGKTPDGTKSIKFFLLQRSCEGFLVMLNPNP